MVNFNFSNSSPLTGNDLDEKLKGLIGYKFDFGQEGIVGHFSDVQCQFPPYDEEKEEGVKNSISRQEHFVNCSIMEDSKTLSFCKASDSRNHGIFIPYLGQGLLESKGHSQSPDQALGTFTSPIDNTSHVSWICSGKFSGCYAYDIRENANADSALIFGHLVTPAGGYTADDHEGQAANIKAVTGFSGVEHKDKISPPLNIGSDGGFVFWLKTGGHDQWERRIVWVSPDNTIVGVDDGIGVTCCVDWNECCNRCFLKLFPSLRHLR